MKNHITRNYRNFSIAVLLASLPFSPINAMEINDATFNASESYAESVVFDLANAQTYSGVVSGDASALTKTGAGTLTLTTNQTFKGATLVSGGAISIDNVSRLASTSGITLSNGGTLAYTAYAATLSPTVTVAANDVGTLEFKTKTTDNLQFQLAGSGKIILAGNSNNSGTEKVSSFLISNASTFTGSVEITGGKLRLTQNMPNVKEFILNGGSIMNNSSMNINNENVKITSTLVLGENGGTIRVGYDNSRLIWTGKITGTGFFGIGGDSGTFCFANSENDFSGGLQIGDVMNGNFNQVTKAELRADNSLGTGLVSFGAGADHSLDLYGFSISTTPIAGLSATRSGVVVKNSKNSVSLLTLSVPEGKSYSYAGKITGKIDLVKNGNGAQILSGSGFTQTGNTTVNAGLLQLTSNAKLAGGLITLENSGTLDLDGLADAGTVAGLAGSSANAILTNSNTETASPLTLNLTNDQTYAGKITGKINLVKIGDATQTISASGLDASVSATVSAGKLLIQNCAQSLSNDLTLDGGALGVSRNGGLALSNLTVTVNGGAIEWNTNGTNALSFKLNGSETTEDTVVSLIASNNESGNCPTFTLTGLSNFDGQMEVVAGKLNITNVGYLPANGIILSGGTLMVNCGNATCAVPITLTDGTFSTIRNGSNGKYVFTEKITGSGQLGISGDNGTTVFQNSGNDFSGGLVLGTLKNSYDQSHVSKVLAGAENTLGSGAVTLIAATQKGASTLDLNGYSQKIGGLISTSQDAYATVQNSSSNVATLTLDVAAGNDFSYAGKLSGKINLVKNGEGSQTLAGSAITYSGSTTVNAGTLKIDSVSSSSQFFLNGGRLYQVSSLNSAAKSAAYVFDGGTLSVTGNSTDHLSNITIEENGGTINWRGDGTKQLYLTLANGTSATSDSLLMLDGINVSGGNCNCFHLVTNKFTGKIGVSGGKLIAKTKDFTNLSGVVLDGGTLMFNADIDSLKNFTLPIEITENGGTLRGGSYVTYTMKGVVSGSGELGISGDNGPIVFANSQNSFSGGLNIGSDLNIGDENKAIAMLGADNALGSGVVSISHAKASLELNGFSLTDSPIAGLSSTVSGAILKNSSSQTSVLTLQVPEGKSESYAGQITGKIDLVKTGAGSQTFSNFQSSGNVLISEGTLNFANGTFSLEDSAFTIEKDGILALSDSSLSVASLAMDLESLLFFDLESDSITLATDSFMGEKGEFSLIWDGMNEMLSGNLADYFSMDQYGFLSLVATPSTNVPEPAAWLLLLCGLGIFGLRAQNRTRSA